MTAKATTAAKTSTPKRDDGPAVISRRGLPIVAIIGRPNVGKSSLFNRFLRRRVAVVDDIPGVTRDRNYAVCDWRGRQFYLVDTGGMLPESEEQLTQAMLEQAKVAVAEADVVLFVVDTRGGDDRFDDLIAKEIRRSEKPKILVANKADTERQVPEAARFIRFGLGEAIPVSAESGFNSGDTLDAIVNNLPDMLDTREEDVIRVAIIGRPNVGKSSLMNRILGEERAVVSPIAGTTRDAIDSNVTHAGQRYCLVDTAGLRRRSKITESVEFYTSLRALKALEDCDVAIIVTDAVDGFTTQDLRVVEQAHEARRGILIAVNKWDAVEKDGKLADQLTRDLKERLGPYAYAPIVYISALTGQRARKTLEMAREIHTRAGTRLRTSELNRFLKDIQTHHGHPSVEGRDMKFNYVTQTDVCPPTFVFFVNHPEIVRKSYISYIANRLYESFDLAGVPLRLSFQQK